MSAPATIAKSGADKVLDFERTAEVLTNLGVTKRNGEPLDVEAIRTWADCGKLPFFKGPHGRRLILHSTLISYFEAEQRKAIQSQQTAAPTSKKRARR